jgi:hypothetical protein
LSSFHHAAGIALQKSTLVWILALAFDNPPSGGSRPNLFNDSPRDRIGEIEIERE